MSNLEVNFSYEDRIIVNCRTLSIHVIEKDEGVMIKIFGKDQVSDEPIISNFTYFQEGENI